MSGDSAYRTSRPSAIRCAAIPRLLCTFSSWLPQVIVTSGRLLHSAESSTVATNPVTWAKYENPDSCGSCFLVKNEPDCRNSPANVPGGVHSACSAASAPRLAPISTGAGSDANALVTVGSTCRTRAVAHFEFAEYHSLRPPGRPSPSRNRGRWPWATIAPAQCMSPAYSANSGPSCESSSGSDSPGAASIGVHTCPPPPPPGAPVPGSATTADGTGSASVQGGTAYPGSAGQDFSPTR